MIVADNIKVTVLEVKGRQVRIGIDAPAEVAVHREEVARRRKDGAAAGGEDHTYPTALPDAKD